MEIMNMSPKCKGKWTWMSRGSKTTIDYILMSDKLAGRTGEIIIDKEEIRWGIGADHAWIQIELALQTELLKTERRSNMVWRMSRMTDWEKYKTEVGKEMKKLKGEKAFE